MASNQLSPKQALAIYYLLFTGKEPLQSKAPLEAKERTELVGVGLIEVFKSPSGRGSCLRLTERAWEWAEENLGITLSKSQNGSEALQSLLSSLGRFLNRSDLRLRDVLVPTESRASDSLDDIQSAYLRITNGNFNVPIRIAELSRSLPNLTPEHLRNALLDLNVAKRVFFARLDDPQSLTDEDRLFTIDVGGNAKHLVAFQN
jgi:hypothetical protein